MDALALIGLEGWSLCAGESKNVLLSPTVSRRLSGIAPDMGVSSATSTSPRRSSVSYSGSLGTTATALATSGRLADHQQELAAPLQPGSLPPDASAAGTVPDGVAATPAAENEPAQRPKRRRLERSPVSSAAAVPVHRHQEGKAVAADGLEDKPFSDGGAIIERLQSVQCDRCGKWRLVEPHYQVSIGPADAASCSNRTRRPSLLEHSTMQHAPQHTLKAVWHGTAVHQHLCPRRGSHKGTRREAESQE